MITVHTPAIDPQSIILYSEIPKLKTQGFTLIILNPKVVNIHAFYPKTVNGFDYGVQLHTLLGVIQSP